MGMHLFRCAAFGAVVMAGAAVASSAAGAASYLARADLSAYAMPREQETALALSAAPPSISSRATVMTLDATGYATVRKGDNGFVCMVQRAWAMDPSAAEFWNPRIRAPVCFNSAARPLALAYLARTSRVLAGATREQLADWPDAPTPDVGALAFMMSRHGYLDDSAAGPWRPHLMVFLPPTAPEVWGANLPASPVYGGGVLTPADRTSVFMLAVPAWSDGSPYAVAP